MISVNKTTVKICWKNQITPIYALFLRGYEICSRVAIPAFPWAGCVLFVLGCVSLLEPARYIKFVKNLIFLHFSIKNIFYLQKRE